MDHGLRRGDERGRDDGSSCFDVLPKKHYMSANEEKLCPPF
jgi:hypothetical protein